MSNRFDRASDLDNEDGTAISFGEQADSLAVQAFPSRAVTEFVTDCFGWVRERLVCTGQAEVGIEFCNRPIVGFRIQGFSFEVFVG